MIDPNIRKLGIGGSDVAAIFGEDEFKDAFSVWATKKGGLARPDKPNIRMVVGKFLEEGVLKLYEYITHRDIEYCDETSQHPERPWMVYTPDALCPAERIGVDAKVVAWDQRRQWGETSEEIPMRVQLQAWWYMAALDYDRWDICALMGEGEPRIYQIERDREAEAAMLARVEEWYVRYILGDERPPMGGNEDAARWLKQMYPRHTLDLRHASAEEITMLTEWVSVCVEQRDLKRRRGLLETYLKSAIEDHEGLLWPEGKFTWRKTKDGVRVDWESMALALLQQHVSDDAERERIERFYTLPKPGVRRIYCDHDALRNKADIDEAAA
jgi:predicted phage-related endonuclease